MGRTRFGRHNAKDAGNFIAVVEPLSLFHRNDGAPPPTPCLNSDLMFMGATQLLLLMCILHLLLSEDMQNYRSKRTQDIHKSKYIFSIGPKNI